VSFSHLQSLESEHWQTCAVPFFTGSSFSQIRMWPIHPLLSSFVLAPLLWTVLTQGTQYEAVKALKMQKAALEFHVNSFAPLHNAIRCDYFRRPVDVPLSDQLSIRVEGTVQTWHYHRCTTQDTFFCILFFPFLNYNFASDSLKSTNGAWRNE